MRPDTEAKRIDEIRAMQYNGNKHILWMCSGREYAELELKGLREGLWQRLR